MLDLHADWEMAGWERGLEEEGTKGVALVERCLEAYGGREEVDD